jgi:hypothetical protein
VLDFVFPADPLDPKRPDEHFAGQLTELSSAGFGTRLVRDPVVEYGGEIAGFYPNATVVYRGWMLDARQYRNLYAAIRLGGGVPLTSPTAYLLAHHLPNWYPLLRDLTPETVIFDEDADLTTELQALGWGRFFLKDYVKSLKTTRGSFISDPSQAALLLEEMRRYRGMIEGGICVRRVETFIEHSERRYFVLHGRAHAPAGQAIPHIVQIVAERVDHPFFSVDVATTDRGEMRVVEIGDGQVSDLVGWSIAEFAQIWPKVS